jgi:signal transduction histidine kinase
MIGHDLSYRIKWPLSIALAILVSGLILTIILLVREQENMRQELFSNAEDLGRLLSRPLISAIKHDDLWQAHELLQTASGHLEGNRRHLIILDQRHRVYVSSHPSIYPVEAAPELINDELARVKAEILATTHLELLILDDARNDLIYVILPLLDQDVVLGALLIGYPKAQFIPKLLRLYWQVTVTSVLALLVLIPFGLWLGGRIASPLTQLTHALRKVGHVPIDQIPPLPKSGQDEIGQLSNTFNSMLDDLAEKERMEHQMIASERLAAIGRLAAGVAHEINNPLGGMLNALATFDRFGGQDPQALKTASLLRRGLEQIRETTSALLVQAKIETHPLSETDIEDIRTLVAPDAQKRGVALTWHYRLEQTTAIPSTPVRQILINLLLNAIAADQCTTVTCRVELSEEHCLDVVVDNDGKVIPLERMSLIFEPFVHDNPHGTGLGLWITYQLTHQLGGEITLSSENAMTRFQVHIPCPRNA